jgi:hypothetical protein
MANPNGEIPDATGSRLYRLGESVIRPLGTYQWHDTENAAVDDDLALVRIMDRTERVPLAWLRRP